MRYFCWSRTRITLLVAVSMFTILACKPSGGAETDPEKEEASAYLEEEMARVNAELEALQARLKWQYNASEDAMGNSNKTAFVHSTNDIYLASPYGGAQKGKLVVRHHSDYGNDIFFSVEQGQITGDKVSVRFDEEKAFSMEYSEPADGSSDVIFLSYNKLIGKLKSAKKMALQVMFYNNGNKVFEFDVSGLDLSRL